MSESEKGADGPDETYGLPEETSGERSWQASWTDPRAFAAAVRSGKYQSGLEILTAMKDGAIPRPPIASLLGYAPIEFSKGRAVFATVPGERFYNPMAIMHGGVAATLLDTAMACAVHTLLPIEVGYTTLELKINYVRAVTVKTGPIRAVGDAVHVGKRTAVAEGRLLDANDKLLATGSTTCLILGS